MSIRIRIVTLVSAACVLTASPAMAWWGDGWLEMLSGPGPLRGRSYDWRVFCLAAPAQPLAPGATPTAINLDDVTVGRLVTKPVITDRAWLALAGCHFLERDRSRVEIGFQFTRLSTSGGNNPLDYTNRPEVASINKAVDLGINMVTADARVNRAVDLGVGIGWGTFKPADGAAVLFNKFTKMTIQPRLTLRLAGPSTTANRWAEFAALQLEATWFVGGFTDEEFGANPGTFKSPGEMIMGLRLVIDPSIPLAWIW